MIQLHGVVLVEGESDRAALSTLAGLCGTDLVAAGIEIVAMSGVTNTRAFALRYGPRGAGLTLAGLYDAPDEDKVRRGLAAAGLGAARDVQPLNRLGFFRCSNDLEDELIGALGPEGVAEVIEAEGETRALQRLAAMPAQREWSREAVLHRFIGVRSGRKARYARLLVEALGPVRAPEPLRELLLHVTTGSREQ